MEPTVLALISFAAVSFGAAAIGLLLRDVAWGSAQPSKPSGPLRLQRLPLANQENSTRSAIGEFDQWFYRLVIESNTGWSPLIGLSFLILLGLLVGGPLFIWQDAPLLLAVGMTVGIGLGLMLLLYWRSRRMRKLQEQLAPAMETLARAVRAGESLDQAIQLLGAKSAEPLALEFRRCANQLKMGLSMSAAMRSLVHRVRLTDVKIFTTTLTVHRQSGGNLAHTLDRLAAVIRDRLDHRLQMRAATGAGRMSATLIASIGPILFVYMFFVQPDYARGLLDNPIGQSLLTLAVFLELVGMLWVARLLRNEW